MAILPDAETFKRLVDGSTRGPSAAAARIGLAAAAVPYALAVAIRNAAYDHGLFHTAAVPAPVIAVGNLTLGGTGKTPLVAWVARRLAERGLRPAIVSRGYAARPGERSDEAKELGLVLPGVTHIANRDRVAGGRAALAAGCDTIILDDGFQHRRLHRDLDVVAIDATDPFGCGHVFPRGLLREPLRGLTRAHAFVLTRATAVSAARREEIRAVVAAHAEGPPRPWMEAEHRPVAVRRADGSRQPLDSLRGAAVVACAGIGNPAAFRRTLDELGANVIAFEAFPDHHAYTPGDRAALAAATRAAGADMLVTTLKDLVKMPAGVASDVDVAAVEIAIEPLSGGAEVADLILAASSATAGGRS